MIWLFYLAKEILTYIVYMAALFGVYLLVMSLVGGN